MPKLGTLRPEMSRCAVLLTLLALSGCSLFSPPIEPAPVPVPVPEPEVVDVPVRATPRRAVEPPEPSQLPAVAIVLTSREPAYLDVATALADRLEDFEVFDLSDAGRAPVSVLRAINDSDSGTVVAIGLRAARVSVATADTPVIFSQVFNHQDYDLLNPNSRGVAPLAPLDAQLAAWTEIDPDISRIGIIIGEGHDELLAEAQRAAEKYKVELRVQVARSDQETLYFFRRMIHDIDGFWLFPDNRVLSVRSLQEIFDTARRAQVSVAVPNESMLKMGAAVSMATEAEDIAATIVKIIRKIQSGGLQAVPDISPLSAIRVVTRDRSKVANR